MGREVTHKWSNFAWTALAYTVVFLLVFPVLWMALTGFKTEIAAINIPPILFFQPTLDQFLLAIQGGFGSYFLELPKEVLEGAWLDGCTTLQTIVRVVVPMAAPGLAAAALLAIIFAWNDFFFAVTLTYTNSPTLPIMVAAFTSNEGLFLAKVSALATMIILVPVAIGIYAQRYLVQGLTGGALK